MAVLVSADVREITEGLSEALSGGSAVWPQATPESNGGVQSEPPSKKLLSSVPDAVSLIVSTSGSTSSPKHVMLSADALRSSAEAVANRGGGHGQWLLALPAHYIAGAQVILRSLIAGTPLVTLADGGGDFVRAADRLVPGIPSNTSLVPTQLARLVAAAEDSELVARALRRFDRILVGGQALAGDLRQAALAIGANVVSTYGSSETGGGVVHDGSPLDGVRVRVDGGRIEIGGPTLALGYLDAPERTATTFTTDIEGTRWYRSDDLGSIVDGELTVFGRVDRVMVSGGIKVDLSDIERVIRTIPGWQDAIALVTEDPTWGQRAVIVRMSDEARADGGPEIDTRAAEMLATATDAAGLSPAARPVHGAQMRSFPLLSTGKPNLVALAEKIGALLNQSANS